MSVIPPQAEPELDLPGLERDDLAYIELFNRSNNLETGFYSAPQAKPQTIVSSPFSDRKESKVNAGGVREGMRNGTLASNVGDWANAGLPRGEILQRAFDWNIRNPIPLPTKEVETTVFSVVKTIEGNGQIVPISTPAPPQVGAAGADPMPIVDLLRAEAPKAPTYLVDQWIPMENVTLLSSHGGTGKSSFMLTLLCHIATGTPFDGRAVRQGGCLYVSLEDPGELVAYRVHLIAQAYQLDLEEIASNLKVLDGSQVDGSLAAERQVSGRKLLSMTDRWTEICGMAKGCVAIAIDNSSDAYDADEVVRRLVRAFMRNLRELALSERAAVILLAHVDKVAARYGASGNSYSGSTAWHNSARSRLAMGLVDDGTVVVTHEKNNLGPLADPLSLVWVEGVLMPVAADAAQMVLDATKRRDLDAAVALIETAVAAGYAVPANTTGPNTTCTVLSQMPGFSDVFTSDAAGRKRLNQSIAALRASGEVLVQEYTNDNRKTARRLALSEKRLLEMEAGSESKTFRVDIDR